MENEEREAIEESIRKWEYLSSGEADDEPDCALCHYADARGDDTCGKCPLFKKTKISCYRSGSLYGKWCKTLFPSGKIKENYNSPEAINAAEDMLEAIKSLLENN